MNLWFWPISIGSGTSLSLVDGEGVAANFSRFLLYNLTTSTLTWDSVRAITTVVSLVLIGGAALKALRRVSPVRGLDREVLRLGVVEHERVG
jgi:energy-coupling factor transport system ATP-binding protein